MKVFLQKLIEWLRKFVAEKLHYQAGDLPYYVTIVFAIILFVVGLNIFIGITEDLAENDLEDFDTRVADYVISFRTGWLTTFFVFVTRLGERFGYFIMVALLSIFFIIRHRNWKFIIQTVLVLLLSTFSNMVMKVYFNRARPSAEHLIEIYSLSYPSGHAMSAMGFFGFLIYLTLRYVSSTLWKTGLVIILALMILCIGISRIYLGVHYPSDVVAGYIGGLIWVTLCIVIFNVIDLYRKRRRRKQMPTN